MALLFNNSGCGSKSFMYECLRLGVYPVKLGTHAVTCNLHAR
ncbi:hypothetical protein [Fischerella muscicola]